jgi:hypothetical protein
MCPLAVAVAHTQPSDGLFASSQRRSRSDRTRGLKGELHGSHFSEMPTFQVGTSELPTTRKQSFNVSVACDGEEK